MKRLIPILTGKEDEEEFIEKIMKGETLKQLILLNIVKREEVEDVPAGYAGSRIKKGEDIMEKIKKKTPSEIEVEENMEWGDPIDKIKAVTKIKDIDQIYMKKSKEANNVKKALDDIETEIRII